MRLDVSDPRTESPRDPLGLLVAIPALLVAMRPRLAAVYTTVAAGSLIGTAVWALIETHAAGGLFYFAYQNTDVLLHLATSTIWLSGAAHYFYRRTEVRSAGRPGQ